MKLPTPKRSNTSWRTKLGAVLVLVAGLLSACSSTGGTSEPTATPAPPPPAPSIASPASTPGEASSPIASPSVATPIPAQPGNGPQRPAATFAPGTAQTISDGVCQAAIPNTWVDNGTGRGTTAGGARYVLFGGNIPDDPAWQRAITLVQQFADEKPGSAVEQGTASIKVTFADDAGFEYRARFGAVYCDFTVTSRSGPVPESERATWDRVIASLEPVA